MMSLTRSVTVELELVSQESDPWWPLPVNHVIREVLQAERDRLLAQMDDLARQLLMAEYLDHCFGLPREV